MQGTGPGKEGKVPRIPLRLRQPVAIPAQPEGTRYFVIPAPLIVEASVRHPTRPARIKLRHKVLQLPLRNRPAQPRHQTLVVTQVVHGGELAAEDLVAAIQVTQVGAAATQLNALKYTDSSLMTSQAYMLSTVDYFTLLGWGFMGLTLLVRLAKPPFAAKAGPEASGH